MSEQFLKCSIKITLLLDSFNRICLYLEFRASHCESFADTAGLASLSFADTCRQHVSKEALEAAAAPWRHQVVLVFKAEKPCNEVVAHVVIVPEREEQRQTNKD